MIDIRDYYWAVRLDQIQHWLKGTDKLLRLDVESAMALTYNLPLLLMSNLWKPWDISTLSPPLHAFNLAWHHLHKQKNDLNHNCGLQIPLTGAQNHDSLALNWSTK